MGQIMQWQTLEPIPHRMGFLCTGPVQGHSAQKVPSIGPRPDLRQPYGHPNTRSPAAAPSSPNATLLSGPLAAAAAAFLQPPRRSSSRASASATAVEWCSLITSWPSIPALGALHFRFRCWEPGFSQDVAGCRGGRWSPRRGRRRGGAESLHKRRLQPCGEQRLLGSLRPRGLRRPERRRPLLSPGLPPRSLPFCFLQF
jgi:hypothetical protein